VLLLTLWLTLPSVAGAELDFGGYYKNELLYIVNREGKGIVADVNKLRLRLGADITSYLSIRVEPQYVNLIKSEQIPLLDESEIDKVDFDRAYAEIFLPAADITVGVQRVAWGTGYLWNPTDVFNPFALAFAIAEEERNGVDAVRVEVPLGNLSGLDFVVLTAGDLTKTKKGIRGKTNIGMFDYSMSYIAYGEDGSQVGFDASGEIFGFGVRTEIAQIHTTNEAGTVKAIAGWNYTFENGLGVDIEYFFNGMGEKHEDNYDWNAYFSGELQQLAHSYVYLGFSKLLDEITEARLSFLVNAVDESFIVYPSYWRNLHENVDLFIEALIVSGAEGTEFKPDPALDPTGFLGSNMYFAKLKFSF